MKKWFSALSIANKLRGLITAACVVVTSLTCVVFVGYEWFSFRRNAVATLTTRARILAINSTASLAFTSPKDGEEILGALATDPYTTFAAIFDESGGLFANYTLGPVPSIDWKPSEVPQHLIDRDRVTVWVPITLSGRRLGTLLIQRSLSDLYDTLRLYCLIALQVAIAAAFFAYWLSSKLQRIVSDPVLGLAKAAGRVTNFKDYTVRVPRIVSDEIGQLTDAFNTMLGTIHDSQMETARLYAEVRKHADELETRVKDRTAQLENANRELEAFSASVSHDLKGPLRYINGYSQILLDDNSAVLTSKGKLAVERIIASSLQMEQLINALLDLSRISKRSLNIRSVDMDALALDVVAELKAHLATDRKVEIKVGVLAPCMADSTLVRQVFVNLLTNAVKFTRTRDLGVVTVDQILDPQSQSPVYFVADNGVGFDMQDAGKLFGAFQRLHDAREFEGTGVGLATVKRIVDRHGGLIWADAATDRGATFYFTFPSAENSSASTLAVKQSAAPKD